MSTTTLMLMGAWVRWIILNLLRPFGIIYGICALIRLLYRTCPPLARKPIWTAVAVHSIALLLIVWIVGVVVCHLLELA